MCVKNCIILFNIKIKVMKYNFNLLTTIGTFLYKWDILYIVQAQ